jgi:hypothetical protein
MGDVPVGAALLLAGSFSLRRGPRREKVLVRKKGRRLFVLSIAKRYHQLTNLYINGIIESINEIGYESLIAGRMTAAASACA